jgi:hypothetical protein
LADVDGLGTINYQWQRNGVDIGGATGSTYTTVQADVGQVLRVVASYTDGQGTAESVASADTAAVTNVNDAPTGSVTIDDTTPTQGQTLIASNTLADADGLGVISYQWQRNGVNIGGATGSTYTTVQADVGQVLRVVASYTDGQGTNESVASSDTAAVTNVNDAPTGSVTIDDTTPTQGQTLTASNTLADADGLGVISYQWQRNGVNIGGATGSTYTTVQADVGQVLRVVASYIDGQGTTESVASSDTAAATNVNDAPTGSVTIDDTTPTQGQTLTASNTLADVDGLGTINYQWQRNGVDIGGATGSTYTTVQADVGQVLRVVASYTDGQGTAEVMVSGATSAVTAAGGSPTVPKEPIVPVILPVTLTPVPAPVTSTEIPSDRTSREESGSAPVTTNTDTSRSLQRSNRGAAAEATATRTAASAFAIARVFPGDPAAFIDGVSTRAHYAAGLLRVAATESASSNTPVDVFRILRQRFTVQESDFGREIRMTRGALLLGTVSTEARETKAQEYFGLSMSAADIGRVSGIVMSAGFVTWALRGSGLLVALLGSTPAWRILDPLPVLAPEVDRPDWKSEADTDKGETQELSAILRSRVQPEVEEELS